jgi:hypothetical protein
MKNAGNQCENSVNSTRQKGPEGLKLKKFQNLLDGNRWVQKMPISCRGWNAVYVFLRSRVLFFIKLQGGGPGDLR